LATAAPAEKSELRTVGVGLGVGVGVGVGVTTNIGAGAGGGGGTNAPCARADVDIEATATASTKMIAAADKNRRPTAVCHARKGRVEQRINAIPKKLAPARQKKPNFKSVRNDLPRVRRDRQSVMAACEGRLPDIVVPLPQC
jgi:hypothetical protein